MINGRWLIVICEEVSPKVARFEDQAAKSQRRDFLVEGLGDTSDGVFGCAVESDSTLPATKKGASSLFIHCLRLTSLRRRTDLYPPIDPIQTIVPLLRERMWGRNARAMFKPPKRFVLNCWKVSPSLWGMETEIIRKFEADLE